MGWTVYSSEEYNTWNSFMNWMYSLREDEWENPFCKWRSDSWDVFKCHLKHTLLWFLLWPNHFMYILKLQWKPASSRQMKAFLCNLKLLHSVLSDEKYNNGPYQELSFHHRKWKIKNKLPTNRIKMVKNYKTCHQTSLNMNLPATAALSEALMPTTMKQTMI